MSKIVCQLTCFIFICSKYMTKIIIHRRKNDIFSRQENLFKIFCNSNAAAKKHDCSGIISHFDVSNNEQIRFKVLYISNCNLS